MTGTDSRHAPHASGRQLRLAVCAVLACGMALALLQRGMLLATSDPRSAPWQLVAFDAWNWGLWLAFSPVIVAAARRWPFRSSGARDAGMHLGAALALAVTHTALLDIVVRAFATGGTRPAAVQTVVGLLSWRLAIDAFVYGAVAAVTVALDAVARARAQELAAARAATEATRARLHALQMQIQPHFVFNTLNTAAMMAHAGDAARAADVITRLADMLRDLVAETAGARVALRDELVFVHRYLGIEQARFGARLRVASDVAPEALDVPVPRLLLQPIVENAVRHGLSRSPTSGRIGISATVDRGWLTLRVTDDGPGLPARDDGGTTGIGLGNTRSRLEALYGDDFELTLGSDAHGATATVRLPVAPAVT